MYKVNIYDGPRLLCWMSFGNKHEAEDYCGTINKRFKYLKTYATIESPIYA